MNQHLLLIEDTATLQLIYSANLISAGYVVDVAATGAEGLALFRSNNNSVVIMDLFLPDVDGVDIIKQLIQENPLAKIIVITSNGSVNRAVEAMRAGAFDFLLKPFSDERLLATVASALASFESKPEIDLGAGNFYGFIGRSRMMQEMYRKIMRFAPSTAPIFVTGERGVGKEICASAIHDHSGGSSRPYVMYNGAGLSPEAQESALFGTSHETSPELESVTEKGAFQKAYGGTLFINEVSDLDLLIQSKLAAYLRKAGQDEQYSNMPNEEFPRIICSTRTDPYVLLKSQKIREDLFYQIHVLTIEVPSLRELGVDIIYMAEKILARFSRLEQKSFTGLSNEVAELFMSHDWPGNLRQLGNLLHKVVASHNASIVDFDMLPVGFASSVRKSTNAASNTYEDRFTAERSGYAVRQLVGLPLEEVERKFIEATIQSQGGSIPKAAEVLGVAPSTIYRKRSKR